MTDKIQFSDGATYERYMGRWSQLVGESFLTWLTPKSHLRWLDVGCGNGAFTEIIAERYAPSSLHGIDPSEPQLAYARTRPALSAAHFKQADAMALPFPPDSFDAAVMPLVIFFVPEPAKGVAEMARVVGPGGGVSAYAWDMLGGGFPYESLREEMRGMGIDVPTPPNTDASHLDALRGLWTGAGLAGIETRQISVKRTFADFEDYWVTVLGGPSVSGKLKAMTEGQREILRAKMHARLPQNPDGRITYSATANAVKGIRAS